MTSSSVDETKSVQLKTEWYIHKVQGTHFTLKPIWQQEDMDFSKKRIVSKVVLFYTLLDSNGIHQIPFDKDARFFCMANSNSLTQYNVKTATFDRSSKITFEHLAGYRDCLTLETAFELQLPPNLISVARLAVQVWTISADKPTEQAKKTPQTLIDQIVKTNFDPTVLQCDAELQCQVIELKKKHAEEIANLEQAFALTIAQMKKDKENLEKELKIVTNMKQECEKKLKEIENVFRV